VPPSVSLPVMGRRDKVLSGLVPVAQAGPDTRPARVRMQYIGTLSSPDRQSILLLIPSFFTYGGKLSLCKAPAPVTPAWE
jgi:hypothetical protein